MTSILRFLEGDLHKSSLYRIALAESTYSISLPGFETWNVSIVASSFARSLGWVLLVVDLISYGTVVGTRDVEGWSEEARGCKR